MKKIISILIVAILLVGGVFLLTGCGNNKTSEGGKSNSESKTYSFPTASFIPSGMEYTGSGKIEYSSKNESITPKQADVYISNAKVEDVVAYVQTLKSKGLKNANAYKEEQTGFNEYGSYSWTGVNSDETFSLSIALSEDSTALNLVEGSYNLLISMSTENPFGE